MTSTDIPPVTSKPIYCRNLSTAHLRSSGHQHAQHSVSALATCRHNAAADLPRHILLLHTSNLCTILLGQHVSARTTAAATEFCFGFLMVSPEICRWYVIRLSRALLSDIAKHTVTSIYVRTHYLASLFHITVLAPSRLLRIRWNSERAAWPV